MASIKGIYEKNICETPIAIVDFETTGLSPGMDRVLEISVAKLEPGRKPYLAFDTLVNPQRPVAATEIHGITDQDVADAPLFCDIAGDFVDALSGCVVAAYNVYFDMKFLTYELSRVGVDVLPPHFCLMYMRPLLDLGSRCNLGQACRDHRIEYKDAHIAAHDVQASVRLMEYYSQVLADQQILTFGQLSRRKNYKFFNSFLNDPLPGPSVFQLKPCRRRKSRIKAELPPPVDSARQAIQEYWEGLRTVLADLEITDDEQAAIIEIRSRLQVPKEQVRMLHAKAFASVIYQFIEDKQLDDKEVSKLRKLSQCLSKLGWAPGE
jgi:DNA polymerase-3 subunit epsilon